MGRPAATATRSEGLVTGQPNPEPGDISHPQDAGVETERCILVVSPAQEMQTQRVLSGFSTSLAKATVLDKEPPESLMRHCPALSLASTEKTESVTCPFWRARTYKHHDTATSDICQDPHTRLYRISLWIPQMCPPIHPSVTAPFMETQAKKPAKVPQSATGSPRKVPQMPQHKARVP